MPDTYLLPAEAATLLRVSPKTLAKWRSAGHGPPYRKVAGRLIRYVQRELEDWMQAQAVLPGVTRDDLPRPPTGCAQRSYTASRMRTYPSHRPARATLRTLAAALARMVSRNAGATRAGKESRTSGTV